MGAFLAHHDVPWVMHFAELDSDKWSQYAGRTGWPMSWVYRREARTLEAYERDLARRSAANVFCTPLEERIFQDRIPGFPSTVMRNGVDLEFFSPSPSTAEAGHLVFTGVMDYYPNVDGCVWFVNEILPRIREHHPDVRFSIVGSRPNAEVQRLATTPGVEVTGFVDDTRDWLRRASLAVAPLRIARGIQNTVLESLAMGLPTVGTTCATQGVSASAGEDYLVADDAEGFARAVVSLLDAPDRAGDLAREGRRFVEEHYDWERTLAPLEELLSLCSDRSSSACRRSTSTLHLDDGPCEPPAALWALRRERRRSATVLSIESLSCCARRSSLRSLAISLASAAGPVCCRAARASSSSSRSASFSALSCASFRAARMPETPSLRLPRESP